jgi:hypothetical protein
MVVGATVMNFQVDMEAVVMIEAGQIWDRIVEFRDMIQAVMEEVMDMVMVCMLTMAARLNLMVLEELHQSHLLGHLLLMILEGLSVSLLPKIIISNQQRLPGLFPKLKRTKILRVAFRSSGSNYWLKVVAKAPWMFSVRLGWMGFGCLNLVPVAH